MTTGAIRTRRSRTKHELRCFCAPKPLLAMYGVDESGRLYVHIRIYKQGKIYGEVYHTGGVVEIRCRNCFRWNRVVFVIPGPLPKAELQETDPPAVVVETHPGQ